MKAYVDHPDMVVGDDYSDIWDYLQPPLMLLCLVLIPFVMVSSIILYSVIIMLLILTLLQLPIATSIMRLAHHKRYYIYILFGLIRSIARCFGMTAGILKFWVFRQR